MMQIPRLTTDRPTKKALPGFQTTYQGIIEIKSISMNQSDGQFYDFTLIFSMLASKYLTH